MRKDSGQSLLSFVSGNGVRAVGLIGCLTNITKAVQKMKTNKTIEDVVEEASNDDEDYMMKEMQDIDLLKF